MKNVLVINSSSPFLHLNGREALDMALIFAAIDQNVALLFRDAAVLCLKTTQHPEQAHLKNYFKTLKTLELYDVDQLYVCELSLKEFGLNPDELLLDVEILDSDSLHRLFKQYEHIVTL